MTVTLARGAMIGFYKFYTINYKDSNRMDNHQISKICRKDKYIRPYFLGVYSSDTLPRQVRRPSCLICNTATSSMPGEHWIAIYFDTYKTEYFCSFGMPPNSRIAAYLRSLDSPVVRSSKTLQSDRTTACGQFTIFFLHLRCCGVPYKTLVKAFANNTLVNSRLSTLFVNGMFNENTVVRDMEFFS